MSSSSRDHAPTTDAVTSGQSDMVERVARAICQAAGRNPDQLEPGNTPYADEREVVDGELRGEAAFRCWRLYAPAAIAAIEAMNNP